MNDFHRIQNLVPNRSKVPSITWPAQILNLATVEVTFIEFKIQLPTVKLRNSKGTVTWRNSSMEEQGRQNGGTAPLTAGSLPANLCRQQNLSRPSDSENSRFLSCFFGLPVPLDSLFLHCSSLLMFLYCSSRLLFLAWSSANGRDKFLSLMKVT